jgi:hypothetical protein
MERRGQPLHPRPSGSFRFFLFVFALLNLWVAYLFRFEHPVLAALHLTMGVFLLWVLAVSP